MPAAFDTVNEDGAVEHHVAPEITSAHVVMEGRTFIVTFQDGEPHNIKQRKVYAPGTPYEALYNAPYWHHSAKLGGVSTMPVRAIAAARAKMSTGET